MSSHGYGGVSGKGKARYDVAKWWERDGAVERTPFQSMHAGKPLACPQCDGQMLAAANDRVYACARCEGSFVEDAALEELISDMMGKPWSLGMPIGTPSGRTCPACGKIMVVEAVEGVTIDRCGKHGTWFDATELPIMLEAAVEGPAKPASWIRRLFGARDKDRVPEARVVRDGDD